MYYVYCIRNKINDKLYIGWTNDYEQRWRSEIKTAFNPNQRDYNTLLSRAFRKYAASRKDVKNHFEFMVLEEFESKDESREAERFYIEFFRTNVSKFGRNAGYNLTDGGEIGILGYKFTDEQKKKLSEKRKGEKNSSAKLTWDVVRKIREEAYNASSKELSQKYKISRDAVVRIINNITWIDENYVFTDEQRIERKKRLHIERNKNNRKITDEQVHNMKKYYKLCGSYNKTSRKYNLSLSTVRKYCGE